MAILLPLVVVSKLFDVMPWWGFLIPVLVLGMVIGFRKWQVSGFLIGFLCGFLLWLGGNLYFHIIYHGNILQKLGTGPGIAILIVSGIVGGVLTGLALHTGRAIMLDKKTKLTL